jgi:hypothetical protein
MKSARPAADRAQARRNSSCPALCRRFVFSPPRAANTWRAACPANAAAAAAP